ncbi:MAG: CDP-diacylglycerol diphosphatase [Proteobacteria bacterium]|nr:CDP-diacylglycerol diphosphatase [Pseudomonadota bacterium]
MKFRPARLVAPALALVAGLPLHFAALADPDALWRIVHDRCVPAQQRGDGPAPCAAVHLEHGVDHGDAVLKDLRGVLQFLLIPTERITGIESPAILAPDATNYWQDAWDARRYMGALHGAPLPRDAIALAINAQAARSQNQLHIHVSCVRPDLRARLAAAQSEIGADWTPLAGGWMGHPYAVRRIVGSDLGPVNPFRLVAGGVPGAAAAMGAQTIAVVGARFADGHDGFYVLAGHTDRAAGIEGSAEDDAQEHRCTVLR